MVFRITPKRLNTVNVLRSTSKLILPVIHPKMLCKSHINQTMITAPSVSIDDALNGDMSAYNLWGCTRLADMLPSKYEDNTLQIKEKSTERTAPVFCTRSYRPFCCRYFGYPSQFGSPVLPQNPHGHQPSFGLGCR